jgi:hypothetical protein
MVETETIIMKLKDKGAKVKLGKLSILLYSVAALVAISGVAMLTVNIYIFKSTIEQYVAQGYPAEMVMQSLIPSQLLPGILEPIGLYGGLVFLLLGAAAINNKISQYSMSMPKAEGVEDVEGYNSMEDTEYATEYVDPIDVEENIEDQELIEVEYTEEEETEEETKNA